MDAPRSREDAREDLESIANDINDEVQAGRYTLGEFQSTLFSKTRGAAASTHQLVHENPWGAMAVGLLLGVLVGMLLPKR